MSLDRLTTALADRYRIERELGQGGMATVYLAADLKHDRKVAIKVLKPELAAVIGADRFVVEIKTTASLQHPHILPLFDSGSADNFLFYVMPYIEGETLRAKLDRETQLGIDEAVSLTAQVADALDYAHRRGVIHRDIKPENILLHDGRPMVADFGIALALSAAAGGRLTETGMSLGTPHYMSPEQATADKEITGRSDIYSLGSVLYEMLAGEPPHIGHSAQQIIMKIIAEEVQPVTKHRKAVPANVAAAVAKSLEKLPADRFESAKAFAAALTDRGFTVPGMAAEMSGGRAVGRSGGRTTLAAWALAAVLGVAALWGWTGPGRGGRGPSVYDLGLPDSAPFSFRAPGGSASYGMTYRSVSIAGNGTFGVYTAIRNDTTSLWRRDLHDATARELPGTIGGGAPRISPDGTRLSYIVEDRLMVMPIDGGERREVYVSSGGAYSHGWLSVNELFIIDQDGYRLTRVDIDGRRETSREIPRCTYAYWDPTNERLICTLGRGATALALDSSFAERIMTAGGEGEDPTPVAGSGFRVVNGRYLIYLAMDGDLVASPYDPVTHLAGRPATLVAGIRREGAGEAQYDIAANGTLLFAPGPDGTSGRMVTLHRGGTPVPLPIERADFQRFDISRDRRRLAATVQSATRNEVRIYDLRDRQQYTWHEAELVRHPLWSPDGGSMYLSARDRTMVKLLRGYPGSARGLEMVFGANVPTLSMDFVDVHDDHLALAQDWTGSIVYRVDPSRPITTLDTVLTNGRFASLSPNARLILFQSRGAQQVVIISFPTPGRIHIVATRGAEPLWLSPSEVLYRNGYTWYSVQVDPSTGEPRGAPKLWGEDPRFSDTSGWSNRPTWDGGIIYVQGPAQLATSFIRVIPDWVDQMKEAVDAANR
jgi:tRNA A-37 threonylcarbamoyl transferase component Bud32